jgi:hypothetical protein
MAHDDSSPNVDAEPDLVPTFVGSMKILSYPEAAVVDVERTIMLGTCFIFPLNII